MFALLRQLADDFLSKARRLAEHIIKPVKNLLEVFRIDRGAIFGHWCRKDYASLMRA